MVRGLTPRAERDPSRFPTADHELAEWEVETLYGAYIKAAVEDMARDIDVFTDMVLAANQILHKRQQLEARQRGEPIPRRSPEPRERPGRPRQGSIAALPADTRTLIARLFVEHGENVSAVARALDDLGVPTIRGGRWSRASIVRVLKVEAAPGPMAEQTAKAG